MGWEESLDANLSAPMPHSRMVELTSQCPGWRGGVLELGPLGGHQSRRQSLKGGISPFYLLRTRKGPHQTPRC